MQKVQSQTTAIKNQMNTTLSFRGEAPLNFLKVELINNVLTGSIQKSIQTPYTILRKVTGILADTKKKSSNTFNIQAFSVHL